jgi:Type III restriction enzyme, res subunit
LSDTEAINYLKLLNEKNVFSLDQASKYFIHKDNITFWMIVLRDICKVNEDIAKNWIDRKEDMITSAMLYHYRISGINKQLSEHLAHFNVMTSEEIGSMYQLKEGRNFVMLINCLNPNRIHDYGEFRRQSAVFMELNNTAQVRNC